MGLFVAIVVSLILSALFSGTEIAYLSANRLVIELKKNNGSRRAAILAGFYQKPSEFLGMLLVGNNIALVVFTTLMTLPVTHMLQALGIRGGLWLGLLNTVIITIVVLIFGEFLPKTLFRLFADQILFALAWPLKIINTILALPAKIMTGTAEGLLRLLFKTPPEDTTDIFTRLDLENFIKSTRPDSKEEIDTEIFEKALHLREVRVNKCMVPRPEVVGIDVNEPVEELVKLFRKSKHSRIIVYDGDIDHVLGYVHHQKLWEKPRSIRQVVMDMPFVPETMRVLDLLEIFIKNHQSIACVVDEFGSVAGITTLEDLLEEIFGEIEDEHDVEEYVEEALGPGVYRFSGRLELDYLSEKYADLHFPEGDYHTLSGYLVMTTGRIPDEGEVIELGDYRFLVEKVSDTKIEVIRIEKLHPEHQPEAQ